MRYLLWILKQCCTGNLISDNGHKEHYIMHFVSVCISVFVSTCVCMQHKCTSVCVCVCALFWHQDTTVILECLERCLLSLVKQLEDH